MEQIEKRLNELKETLTKLISERDEVVTKLNTLNNTLRENEVNQISISSRIQELEAVVKLLNPPAITKQPMGLA